MLQQLCGVDAFQNVILGTTGWISRPSLKEALEQTTVEQHLKKIYWKEMMERGAYVEPHYETAESARRFVTWLADRPPRVLQSQREMVDEELPWDETTVGKAAGGADWFPSKKDAVSWLSRKKKAVGFGQLIFSYMGLEFLIRPLDSEI